MIFFITFSSVMQRPVEELLKAQTFIKQNSVSKVMSIKDLLMTSKRVQRVVTLIYAIMEAVGRQVILPKITQIVISEK